MTTPLTERKAKDRELMAKLLAARMVAVGATVERDKEWEKWYRRSVVLMINAPGGARLTVYFNGLTPKQHADTFVSTWNFDLAEEYRDKKFNPLIGDVNPYHRRKYSHVTYGFESLVTQLESDVKKFVSGEGYLKT